MADSLVKTGNRKTSSQPNRPRIVDLSSSGRSGIMKSGMSEDIRNLIKILGERKDLLISIPLSHKKGIPLDAEEVLMCRKHGGENIISAGKGDWKWAQAVLKKSSWETMHTMWRFYIPGEGFMTFHYDYDRESGKTTRSLSHATKAQPEKYLEGTDVKELQSWIASVEHGCPEVIYNVGLIKSVTIVRN